MEIRPRVLLDRPLTGRPRVSLVLLDWSCRESFHIFDYLAKQDVPRDWFEVLWIEYYDRVAPEITRRIEDAQARHEIPPVDRWIVMGVPHTTYYHKHLMYNVGVLASRGELVMIGDSDAMVTPRLVRALCTAFEEDPHIVLHLDEVRGHSRRFFPFNYPSFEEVIKEGCINWKDGKTTGVRDGFDPLHSLNYGACFCAQWQDVVAIGGSDEHIDYLGHICGPYDLTWRLKNFGRREVWHQDEFLYHVWHPGSDGEGNYLGPHDGRNVSTVALQTRRNRRVMPLVENPAIRRLREDGTTSTVTLEEMIRLAIGDRPLSDWLTDDLKQAVSAGRTAWAQRRYIDALAAWEPIRSRLDPNPRFLNDLGWAYYFVGRFEDARRAFEGAISLEPDNPDARRGLGWTLTVQGRHREAIAEYTVAIDIADPVDRLPLQEAYRGRAWSYLHYGQLSEAANDFEAASGLTRADDTGALQDIQRGLGWLRLREGMGEQAAQHFANALEALGDRPGPEYDNAFAGLIQARAMATAAPPAPAPVRLAAHLRSDLGWAYFAGRQYERALTAFLEAVVLDGENRRAACGLGWTSLHLNRLREARAAFDGVLAHPGQLDRQTAQEAFRGRAWVGYREGRSAEAVEDFTRALQLADPARDAAAIRDIQRGRSHAYYLAGLRTRALEELARIEKGSRWYLAARMRGGAVKNRIAALLREVR